MIYRILCYLIAITFWLFNPMLSVCFGDTPDVAEGLYRNALSLLNQGLADKALDDFKRIANNYPTSEYADDAYYLIGKYYYDQRIYSKSLEALNMVINSYGNQLRAPAAYYLKANIYMDSKYDKFDYQDAYANFSRIFSIYRDSEWVDRGYYGAGLADYKLREYAKARDLFRHVTDEFPDSEVAPESQFYQGMCYAHENQVVWALQSFQKVIDNYPASSYAKKAKGLNSLLYRVYFLPERNQRHTYKHDQNFRLQNFDYDDAISVCVDFNGHIAVANEGESAIYIFDDQGQQLSKEKYNYKLRSVHFIDPDNLIVGFKSRVLYDSKYLKVFFKKKKDTLLDQIERVIIDNKQKIYVVDKSNSGILTFGYRDDLEQFDVKDIWPHASIKDVEDLDIDGEENIFFINNSSKTVDKCNLGGTKLGSIPRETSDYRIKSMDRIALDLLGNIYILDSKIPAVFLFNRDLDYIQTITIEKKAIDIAVDYKGEIFLINVKDKAIDKYF